MFFLFYRKEKIEQLVAALGDAKELLLSNIELPGYGMSAKAVLAVLDQELDNIKNGQKLDRNELYALFSIAQEWDDLTVQMNKDDGELASKIAVRIIDLL
ncbi:hypothetical protein RYZ26_07195 [Terasakiella sp. A23]|uniref:hypothetical protein n=1 Tax=Terasakiella sp. FCG-A23 TaxID=3080561 RepID=UPI0029553613|nr:hypothetical protein [Terasakiella sp. A23]MDV7339372.1 hypothetical protein [Terasakiella sp. A23]